MTNVIQLFPKMSLDDAKAQIVENLKEMHHSKPVNYFCAISGIKDFELQHEALNALIRENVVCKQVFNHRDRFGNASSVPLYKYNILCHL